MEAVMTKHPPTSLLQLARKGDRAALESLFRQFQDRLLGFIRSRIAPGYAARLDPEDILQETFVRAFQSIHSFRGEDLEGFRRWVTGVANKAVLRAREKLCQHRTLEIQDLAAANEASPSRAIRRRERLDRLQKAIDSLAGDYRQVIFLTRIEGLTLQQTADKMGRSAEAVRKLFWRALQQLRSTLSNTASLHLPDGQLEWADKDDTGPR